MIAQRWTRAGAVLVLAWWMAGCSVTAADEEVSVSAIARGLPDRGRDPAVVALMLGRDAMCSGTLIAPRAVLTARHCVSQLVSEAVDCTQSGAQITSDRDPTTLAVITAETVQGARAVAHGTRVLTPNSDRLCNADIAVVILDRDVTGIDPVPVDTTHHPRVGQDVVAVGYGMRGTRGTAGTRERRSAVPIVALYPHEIELGTAACSGDSGGPALDAMSGAIVGIVSRGGSGCSSASARNVYSRVDGWAPLIDQAYRLGGGAPRATRTQHPSSASGDTPSDLGAACQTGDECESGYCVRSTHSCTMTCDADTPCPAGYYCGNGSGGVHACFHRG